MYYPEDVVEEVRTANNIVDTISQYVKLTKKGNSYFGLCPFHNEKSPSFSVSPDKQMYYCFGCGAGGNVFTFLMEYENFTFSESLQYLAERAGIRLPVQEESQEARREADLKQKILEVNKEAAKYYYAMLYSDRGKLGKKYFQTRKLSPETMKQFGLGYADNHAGGLYRYLKSKGYDDHVLRESGLFHFDERRGMSDKFWDRVMFPIMDINNKVIGFGGRVMGDAKPKYLNSPETKVFDKSRNLYGLNVARRTKKKSLILCEGYMDVISLHQAGFTEAVASLGTAFTSGQAALIRRYTEKVYLVYDSDGAGIKAILRALPILRANGIDGKVVHLEPYKDPDEFIKNLGADAFQKRLDDAENGFLFSIGILERDYDMKTPEGRTRFFRKAAEELLVFEEDLERNTYIQAVADKYLISAADLKKMVMQNAMRGVKTTQQKENPVTGIDGIPMNPAERPGPAGGKAQTRKKAEDGLIKAQKLLLTWMIDNPGLFAQVRKYVYPGDFTVDLYRQAAELLYRQQEEGQVIPAKVISCFPEEADQKEIASLFNAHLPGATDYREQEKAVKETILRVKRASVDAMGENLNPADMNAMQELIKSRRALQDLQSISISLE